MLLTNMKKAAVLREPSARHFLFSFENSKFLGKGYHYITY
jgi:hypothetical protein